MLVVTYCVKFSVISYQYLGFNKFKLLIMKKSELSRVQLQSSVVDKTEQNLGIASDQRWIHSALELV